ncbi:MAG: DUF488 domain-containing protein [Clostridia bacterium]|nr:DUF488 domain-containing protein [Clostridia bacterium]
MNDIVIYTIGYTGFTRDEMLQELINRNINALIDVRSSPFSERYPDYNKVEFAEFLKLNGIVYRNYSVEFGARQDAPEYYTSDGYLDFNKFAASKKFIDGVNKIISSAQQNYKFVLMCAEKDPITCHRTILVAKAFYERGCHIIHILPNHKEKTQKDIERELLDKYFPRRDQISFDDMNSFTSEEEYISKAYTEQAKKIAYRKEDE